MLLSYSWSCYLPAGVGDAPPAEQTTSNVESTPSIPKAIIIAGSSVMATRSSSLHRSMAPDTKHENYYL
jgi:hypothetical protein